MYSVTTAMKIDLKEEAILKRAILNLTNVPI